MFKKIKRQDLKLGMYVILPPGFMFHKFKKHQLLIDTVDTLERILSFGLDDITVDISKSPYFNSRLSSPVSDKKNNGFVPIDWDAAMHGLVPPELNEVIHDKNIEPLKKAHIVYNTSLKVMEKLLEDPSIENIRQYKDGVKDIVDMVLTENDTANYLSGLTSHDYYTYTHSVNVGVLSLLLSKRLLGKSDSHDLNELAAGFFLHDLGKTRIDKSLITKPGKLTGEEYADMKKHPELGYEILKESPELSEEIRIIVQQHHERYDGSGYPNGLKGDDIHLYGRLCSIADVFDALTSRRPYKPNMSAFDALTLMKKEMIHHFDSGMFENFVLLFA